MTSAADYKSAATTNALRGSHAPISFELRFAQHGT
jgi:hypothetical protein